MFIGRRRFHADVRGWNAPTRKVPAHYKKATFSQMRTGDELLAAAIDLAWSLWGELGVSTWSPRSHRLWAVELEPLLAFTALVAPHDERLLRESVSWCAAHPSFVSLQQLRTVVTTQRWPFAGEIHRYGATLARYAGLRWAGLDGDPPYDVVLSGKSRLGSLHDPSLIQLRLRAIFGVSARAEIVRVLLTRPSSEWSVTQLADRVPYTRRQVSADLEMLALGGLTHRAGSSGKFTYALVDHDAFRRLVGEVPAYTPQWAPLFRIMSGLLDAVTQLISKPPSMPGAELARQFRLLEPPFAQLRLSHPRATDDGAYFERGVGWVADLFSSVSRGDAAALKALGVSTN